MTYRTFLHICTILLLSVSVSQAQRICGSADVLNNALNANPELKKRYLADRQQRIEAARMSLINKSAGKPTAAPTIPVVVHILLTQTDLNSIGGVAGVAQRIDSQIAVINRDFTHNNPDAGNAPAAFQSIQGDAQITFGLAHTKPDGSSTPGYTITTATKAYHAGNYEDAKHSSIGGVDAWDTDKYLNIWVVRFAAGLLGVTTPSFIGSPQNEVGIVLNYMTFGKRVNSSDIYDPSFDLGKTLTHELGHFFDIWHPSGDDATCPSAGGQDDGISDTPPSEQYSTGVPPFPLLDGCSPNSPGVMFMNYMDYSDDVALNMFTLEQCLVMHNNVLQGGSSYGLTLNPQLLQYPTNVANIKDDNAFQVFPNPTMNSTFQINVAQKYELEKIVIMNVVGQTVKTIVSNDKQVKNHNVDLTTMSKGVYTVQCIFAGGKLTKKIVLQ